MNPDLRLKAVRILHQSLISIILVLSLFGLDSASATAVWIRGLMIAALATLGLLCCLENFKAADFSPSLYLTLAVSFLLVCVVGVQSDVFHHYPARQFLFHFIFYLSFFMALLPLARRPEASQRLATYLSLVGLLAALIGIAYRFTGSWDILGRHKSQIASASFGFFYYENTFGAFAALLLPLTAGVLYYRYARYAAGGSTLLERMLRFVRGSLNSGVVFLGASLLVMGIGLVATNSRASLLILLIFYFGIALVFLQRKYKLAVIGFALLSVGGFALLSSKRLLEITVNGFAWDRLVLDLHTRLEIFNMNFHLFMEKPWFGWGMGNYPYVSTRHLVMGGPDAINTTYRIPHAHGSYADVLVEGGLIVLFLFCAAAVIVPFHAWMKTREDGSVYRRLTKWQGLMALISFAPMLLSDSHLRVPIVVLMMLLQLAILAAATRPYDYEEHQKSHGRHSLEGRRFRIVAYAVISCFAAVLCFDALKTYQVSTLLRSWIPNDQKLAGLLRHEPDNPETYFWGYELKTGQALKSSNSKARKDLYRSAAALIDQGIALVPFNAYYYLIKGRALWGAEDPEAAMQSLERAVELSPNNIKHKTDLMLACVFMAKDTPSILARNRWNLRARKLYEEIRSNPLFPESGFEKLRSFLNQRLSKDEKQYVLEFFQLADKYKSESKS